MSTPTGVAERLYALCLRAFPSTHRSRYATEMMAAFRQEIEACRRNGGVLCACRFAMAAYQDAILAGVCERRRPRRSQTRHGPTAIGALDGLLRDVVYAFRSLARAKTYTLVCVASLAVGIGSCIGLLLFLNYMWAPAEGVEAEGLLELVIVPRGPVIAEMGGPSEVWSLPDFLDVRDGGVGLTVTASSRDIATFRVRRAEGSAHARVLWVAPDYMKTVGTAPALGRDFTSTDGLPSAPVAIIGWDLWQNRLGGRPDVIGTRLIVNRVEHAVIGVTPERFHGHRTEGGGSVDIWLPLQQHPTVAQADGGTPDRGARWLNVLARMPAGMNIEQANAALTTVMARLENEYPATNRYIGARAHEYMGFPPLMVSEFRLLRRLFLSAAALVLAIVCLNLAGMALVRSATRERELAVRLAMGSSRGGLLRTLMSEAMLISMASGLVAVIGVFGGLRYGAYRMGETLPDSVEPGLALFSVCAALSLVATLATGIWPALRFSRPELAAALRTDASGGSHRTSRVHRLATAMQAAFAVPFLVIGLIYLIHSRTALFDLGFPPDGLYAVSLDLADHGYEEPAAGAFLATVRQNVRGIEGVQSVSVADGLPLDFDRRASRASTSDESKRVPVRTTRIAEGYLGTVGVPTLVGRDILDEDRPGSEPVALVSESLSKRLWPEGNPLSQLLIVGEGTRSPTPYRVVGVVADVAGAEPTDSREAIYLALAQHPGGRVYVVARASGHPGAITDAFQEIVTAQDRDLIRPTVVTGTEMVESAIRGYIFSSTVAGGFSLVALLLAALGVYGIIAFMVATRTRDMGVRLAIGATRTRVIGDVLRDSVRLVLPGLTAGCAVAAAIIWSRTGIPVPGVPVLLAAFAGAITITVIIAMAASLGPAIRAAAVQPVVSMRGDQG